ncbi:MAG: C-terminal domain of the GTP 3' 8'-cyclase MoaA [Candidatus Alkanophagales archaeon MCA70_species_1]|nr:C-terminal domain of the GTP 3' 8'-cyclase MoaA [Candidatus Alkanophaga volatiphilum]
MRMETKSLCPECLSVIPAEVYEEGGKILIRKRCEEHGEFEDIYWADAELYKRFSAFESVGKGFATRAAERGCPYDCGLCPAHKTTTLLANIDVTNRCNQRCPTCFANAAASGRLYEPSQDEIWKMLEVLRSEVPPCPAVQFAGGEPTVRSDFVELVKMAKKLGFAQIQVATNGIMLAKSVEFCERLVHAGLHTVYLQFDGVKEEAYEKLRGRRVLKTKLKAVENCRAGGIRSVVLVPTLARGVNDDQIGDIIRYAVENLDVVRGVNVQPVSFTGRIDKSELRKLRITIPDFIKLVEEQTDGQIPKESFYPVPAVVPVSRFVEAWKGEPQVAFTVHPHCGAATYVFVDGKRLIPITDFVDVEGILEFLKEKAEELERARLPALAKLKVAISAAKQINKFIDAEKAPSGAESMRKVIDILTRGDRESTAEFHRRTLFIGCMHFMDPYNFDIKRVQRCGIHYVTPDLRIIPFCTYNTLHRPEVEAKFSRTL